MKDEIKKYLYDIKTSIETIENFIGEKKDFKIYMSNKLLRRGVERELEIIGEAVNKLQKIETPIILENAKKIVGTRNVIIHGYDKVDDTIIWSIVVKHLPILKRQVEKFLNE